MAGGKMNLHNFIIVNVVVSVLLNTQILFICLHSL